MHVSHPLAEALDLMGDSGFHILPGGLFLLASALGAGGPVVQLPADLFQGAKGEITEQESRHQRRRQRNAHQRKSRSQPRLIGGAQKRGAHSDVHRGKGLAIALQRHHHVEDPGRTQHDGHQLKGIGVAELAQAGTDGQWFIFVVGIGAQ